MKTVLRFAITFLSLMALFSLLMMGAYALPTDVIREDIFESVSVLDTEGLYPMEPLYSEQTMRDNFTEALALSMAATEKPEGVVYNAFDNGAIFSTSAPTGVLYRLTEPDIYPEYAEAALGQAKYWNGLMIFLKPLLLITTYANIRWLCYLCVFSLFVAVLLSLYKRLGLAYAAGFAFSLLMVQFYIVPSTVTMVPAWCVAFCVCLIILVKKTFRWADCMFIFFCAGCLVGFFDYLLTMLYALGIPLVILIAIVGRESLAPRLVEKGKIVVGSSVAYFVAILLTLAAKWTLASLITGDNVWASGLSAILRNGGAGEGQGRLDGLHRNYAILLQPATAVIIAAVLLVLAALLFIFRRKKPGRLSNPWVYLFLALYPCIWYVLLSGHSYIHAPFTYRYTGITVLAVVFGLLDLINLDEVREDLSTVKGKLRVKQPKL